MKPRFADLHCHPHMRSFNWLHKAWRPEEESKYNPWWIILPKLKAARKAGRAAAYSQSDLVRITNGNMKLAFVSLYPTEKGWVTGRKGPLNVMALNFKKVFGNTLLNLYVSQFVNKILDKPTFLISQDKGGKLALRDIIQKFYMNIPFPRVNFIQSKKYDYFAELKEERKFIEKGNGLQSDSKLFIPPGKRIYINKQKLIEKNKRELQANGSYTIAENGSHVKEIIDQDKTAFVYSIEGANVFNTQDSPENIIERIREVKNWTAPVFFISFSHHFYNHLAGHAHSIPDVGNLVLDQSEGLNTGFTEKGFKIARYLLSIDEDGNYLPDEFGKRIIIDVKHMNAIAREEYYNNISLPSLKTNHPIPVIASHVAFSGRITLQELIDNMANENDGDSTPRNGQGFNNWNINLCDEDVINIYKSKGIIGINLDQRVLGVEDNDIENENTHANYVWQNIKVMMQVVFNSDDHTIGSKNKITNMFCLGTDFDGFIDPLNKYPTVLEFEQLHYDLIAVIEGDPEAKELLFGINVIDFVDKFCFRNAYDFVVKNFK